jgi:hypothetical protein
MSKTSMWAGLITSVGISFVAGLGQSFAGLNMAQLTAGFDWVLAIFLSALTALEYFAGDLMGAEWVLLEKTRDDTTKAYMFWLANARKGLGIWKAQFASWAKAEGITINDGEGQSILNIKDDKPKVRTSNNADAIRQLLNELYNKNPSEIPTVAQTTALLAERLVGMGKLSQENVPNFIERKKSYVSSVRKGWIKEKNLIPA